MHSNYNIPIKIGTRASELAIAQANQVKKLILEFNHSLTDKDVKIIKINTSGDKFLNESLSLIGGKGLFTKEIDEMLMKDKLDLAVHSMKDLPAKLPDQLTVSAILEREEATDAFISHKYMNLFHLPQKAIIGTSSIRRKAILLHHRPDLKIVNFRGNINTRLRKLKEENIDGIILATAGLKRIGIPSVITKKISTEIMTPAIGQGAIGVVSKTNNSKIKTIIKKLNHEKTEFCVNLERRFMAKLDGSCKTPIACFAKFFGDDIQIKACIIHPDGSKKIDNNIIVAKKNAVAEIDKIVNIFKNEGADIIKFIKNG